MKLEATLGSPTEPGIYAARQWYAWRILQWHEGEWWHEGLAAKWPKGAEIEAYIGPLPRISRDFTKTAALSVRPFDSTDSIPPVMEFDL